jgi:hypothetical protein
MPKRDFVSSAGRLLAALDIMWKPGVRWTGFRGSPGRPGKVGRMGAAGDHRGSVSRAAPATRPAMPGPWRLCIVRQFTSPPDLSPLPVSRPSSSAGDHPAQPYPVLPPRQLHLLDRVRNSMRSRTHRVMTGHSIANRFARLSGATSELAGIIHSTLLTQERAFGSNVPDDDMSPTRRQCPPVRDWEVR